MSIDHSFPQPQYLPEPPEVPKEPPHLLAEHASFAQEAEKKGLSKEEIEAVLQYVDRNLSTWVTTGKEQYIKKNTSGLARTIEYMPETKTVALHFKRKVTPVKGQKGAPLGQGAYGIVTYSIIIKNGQFLVNKCMKKELKWDSSTRSAFKREVEMQQRLGTAKNVVKAIRVRDKNGVIGILYEMMGKGDLGKQLKTLSPDQKKCIARDAINGMREVHKARVVHKDIKPDNLMMNDQNVTKLGDLGLSVDMDDSTSPNSGTPAFLSPENFQNWLTKQRQPASTKDDTWAMGITLYMVQHGGDEPSFMEASETLHKALSVRDNVCVRQEVLAWNGEGEPPFSHDELRASHELQEMLEAQKNVYACYKEYVAAVASFENSFQRYVPNQTIDVVVKEMLHLDPNKRIADDAAFALAESLVSNMSPFVK